MKQEKVKEPKVRRFKMVSAFTMLLTIILIIIIVSWILNCIGLTTEHKFKDDSGTMVSQNVKIGAAGFFDLFWAPMQGFIQKADIIIFIISIGAFINMLLVSDALTGSAQWITRKLKGKEIWAIIPLMIFFSICGTTEGMAEESLGFYMICVPLMVAAGFDTFTGLMIVLLGAGVGVMGSTVNPFLITVAVDAINGSGVGNINTGDGIIWRLLGWFIFIAIAIGFVVFYALKIKKDPSKSITFATAQGDKEYFLTNAQKTIVMDWRKNSSLTIFAVTLLVMIIYLIGWDAILGGTRFADAGKWMNSNVPWLTAFIPGFGVGSLVDVAAFFLISALVVGAINWKGESDFIKKWMTGASDILSVCLIIATASGVGVILQGTYIQDLIVNGLSNAVNGLNVTLLLVILFLLFLPLSFLIPSTSGFATAIFPILGPVLMSMPHNYVSCSGAITAFSQASGILNLFTPTSGVVMGALALSRISYEKLLKGIWPLLLIITVVSILLLIAGSFVGGTIF